MGTTPRGRRKFSLQPQTSSLFPAAPFGGSASPSTTHQGGFLNVPTEATSRRRFSQHVSDAVSRRFSTTLNWAMLRAPSAQIKEIREQSRSLAGKYIRARLKRSGMISKKCGIQRLRNLASIPGGEVVGEVYPVLLGLGLELERLHPKTYTGVVRQACCTPVLTSPSVLTLVIPVVAKELARDISWAKVVALYAVAGGLAVDCVRQGHPDFLEVIVETVADAVEEEMSLWIAENGGWNGLLTFCKPPPNEVSVGSFVAMLGSVLLASLVLILLYRWFR